MRVFQPSVGADARRGVAKRQALEAFRRMNAEPLADQSANRQPAIMRGRNLQRVEQADDVAG